MRNTQEMHNINMHMKIMTTNQTTDLASPENPLFSPKPISAITPMSPNFSEDLELQELLNILLSISIHIRNEILIHSYPESNK